MQSTIIDIADAIVAELNSVSGGTAGPFSKPFTAVRHYKPVFDLREMKSLHVSVVPRGVELIGATRSAVQTDVQIDIAVQQKLSTRTENTTTNAADAAEIDALMRFVEEISDYFRSRRLAAFPNVAWVRTENVPIYSPEHLEQFRQFSSVVTLTFRVLR